MSVFDERRRPVSPDLHIDASNVGSQGRHEGAVLLVVQGRFAAFDGGADGRQDGQGRGVRDVAGHAHEVVGDLGGGHKV